MQHHVRTDRYPECSACLVVLDLSTLTSFCACACLHRLAPAASCAATGLRLRCRPYRIGHFRYRSPSIGAPLTLVVFSEHTNTVVTSSGAYLVTWDASSGRLLRCFTAAEVCGPCGSKTVEVRGRFKHPSIVASLCNYSKQAMRVNALLFYPFEFFPVLYFEY